MGEGNRPGEGCGDPAPPPSRAAFWGACCLLLANRPERGDLEGVGARQGVHIDERLPWAVVLSVAGRVGPGTCQRSRGRWLGSSLSEPDRVLRSKGSKALCVTVSVFATSLREEVEYCPLIWETHIGVLFGTV